MGKLSKDKRDIYYRLAKEEGYRARSAYKLIQIDQVYNILSEVHRVVDLCAAPGSWSQVLVNRMQDGKIVSVDLQEISPIEGIHTLQGDITSQDTAQKILEHFDGECADLVICDGAPDVTGMHDMDEYIQHQLVLAANAITTCVLKEKGAFIAKIFRGENVDMLYHKLGLFFEDVQVAKPKASRNSSTEAFVVCRRFRLPENYTERTLKHYREFMEKIPRKSGMKVPFVACADERDYDADRNYTVEDDHQLLAPVQSPIEPPYAQALRAKRGQR